MNDTGDLILRGNWIVLPSIYQNLAVNVAHAGHLGLTKTKALLRSKLFFPNMDKITTQVLGLCTSCKFVTPSHDRQKLISQPTPSDTLDIINLDFLDPFPNGNDRPTHEISQRRFYEKHLGEKCYFCARTVFWLIWHTK